MKVTTSSLKRIAIPVIAVALAGPGTPALASSLTSIGVLNPARPYSEIRALSQDGTYAVGTSASAGAEYSGLFTNKLGTNVPIVWSLASGLVELRCPSGKHTIADGVALGWSTNSDRLLISGSHEGVSMTRRFTRAPTNALNTSSWTDAGQYDGAGTSELTGSGFAMSRAEPDSSSGRWFMSARREKALLYHRTRIDPANQYEDANCASTTASSMSSYGFNVGRRTGISPTTARYQQTTVWGDVPNSTGCDVWGQGISAAFGATNLPVEWICGQVGNYWTNGSGTKLVQAFRWNRADADLTPLGSLAPAGGGAAENNSSTAYCIANTGVTGGRSYFGDGTGDIATIWDTSGTWDNTGAPKNLKDLLAADGVDTSAWTKLSDVYACSDDGKVLAGYGVWAADSSIRGFVAIKSAAAPVAVQVTSITVTGSTVTIDFTSSNTSDTTASFVVQEAGTLVNAATVFNDITSGVTITGSAGSFQATFAPSGDQHFYRIKRP